MKSQNSETNNKPPANYGLTEEFQKSITKLCTQPHPPSSSSFEPPPSCLQHPQRY